MVDKHCHYIENEVSVRNRLEQVFSHWMLLFINVAIIIFVEATSMFFMRTGLIHLIAILFIALGISRIFVHYDVYDQYLKPLIHGGILTLIIFAVSHVLEYFSYSFLYLPYDAIAANVVNLYLTGLLIIILSVEHFLKRIEKEPKILPPILYAGVSVSLALTVLFFFRSNLVELTTASWLVYGYGLAVVMVAILGIRRLLRLRSHVTILVNFVNYFTASFALVSASALLYVLNDLLESVGVPYMQVMYISHFLFYGASSLMFLAFVRISRLGGVYEGLG